MNHICRNYGGDKSDELHQGFEEAFLWGLQEAESLLRETWAATCPSSPPTKAAERSIRHAAAVCASLSVAKTFDLPAWTKEVSICKPICGFFSCMLLTYAVLDFRRRWSIVFGTFPCEARTCLTCTWKHCQVGRVYLSWIRETG